MASSMATRTSVCVVCDLQHQTTQSAYWCIQCEEPLCAACEDHHSLLKATRNHKTISIADFKLLSAAVTDIEQHCIYHNEMYQLYCNKHESPICNKCVKDHGKCGEILSLDELVKDIKTSEFYVELEQSLNDISSYINVIRKNREVNIESITDQKKNIAAEVSLLKKQVIQHVNKLEEEFIKELNQIEFECCDPIHLVVLSLQDKEKEIHQIRSDIQNTTKYASDLQAFLSMKENQAKIIEFEKQLQLSIENKDHENINIESSIDTTIQDILTVDRFGSIKVQISPSYNIDLNRKKYRQAQTTIPKAVKLTNDVESKHAEFKRELNEIYEDFMSELTKLTT
ncbi:transcription intermediary factor 1-beta-like [Mytilus trossulus]|uniref:transcription intermediary factor 1-beta-like n=1 Tax=Mytilus trossulus TaxID=6551 RepID=UPI003004613F